MMDAQEESRYGQVAPRRYYGKYAGLVTANDPPDDGTPHRGQVMVQVPGILEETPDGEGNQALAVLAAPAFLPGFFFVPDVKAQVWVEFVAGDINFPIWTGVWYPDNQSPKAIDPSQPTQPGSAPTLDQKIIRTRSGQVIQLEDTDSGEQTVIKDEKNGNAVTLDKDGITLEATASGAKVTLQFGSSSPTATLVVQDQTLTLTAGGSNGATVVIDASKNTVTLAAGGSSGSSITIDASAGVTLKCGSQNQVSIGSTNIQLAAGGVTATLGNGTMDVS